MQKSIIVFLFFSSFVFMYGCSTHEPETVENPVQLNVSILLDLSDRIDTIMHPFQVQIDTENIKTIISLFKSHQSEIGPYDSKGKMKLFFYPPPTNNDIISIAKKLNVDFTKTDFTTMDGVSERIKIFKTFDTLFMSNVHKLYQYSTQTKEYPGADIWTFFKDEVDDQCLEKDSSYRNILVIITDGYIYWDKNCRNPIGNRFTYITAKTKQVSKFRKMKKWEDYFDKEDYGFVDVNKNLSNLDVLVLGIDPATEEDCDIIKKYWEKWFLEMKIKPQNIKIIKTELPVKTNIIENFFSKH